MCGGNCSVIFKRRCSRFESAVRRLLLDLAPIEPFDVEFVRIPSCNSRAGELPGELQTAFGV